MKRVISLVLLIILTAALFSCSQPENEVFDVDLNADTETDRTDFDGFEISVWSCTLDGNREALFGYVPGTLASDLVLKRIRDIETEFNCRLSVNTDGTGRLTGVVPALASGTYVGDVMFLSSPADSIRAGLLYRLDALQEYIDYTDIYKYGGYGSLEQGLYNSVPYTVSPARWPGKQETGYSIFAVNENIIMRNALTDPRDYLENGEWTWDTFERCLTDYRIDDGSVKTTSVNFTWSILDLCMMNGGDYYTIQDNGTIVPALDSEQIAEALDYCSRIFTQYQDCVTFHGHDAMLPRFKNNEIVLTQTCFDHIVRFMSYDMENYGIVPMPCGPRGKYGEWIAIHSEHIAFGIFYNTNDPVASAMVVDRFCDPLDGYETDEELKEYISDVFFDDRDVELLMELTRHMRWQYWPITPIYDFFTTATSAAKTGKSSAEIIEKYSGGAVQSIIKHVIPNVEFIENFKANQNH